MSFNTLSPAQIDAIESDEGYQLLHRISTVQPELAVRIATMRQIYSQLAHRAVLDSLEATQKYLRLKATAPNSPEFLTALLAVRKTDGVAKEIMDAEQRLREIEVSVDKFIDMMDSPGGAHLRLLDTLAGLPVSKEEFKTKRRLHLRVGGKFTAGHALAEMLRRRSS